MDTKKSVWIDQRKFSTGTLPIKVKRVGLTHLPLHPSWLVKDVWKRVVNPKNQLFYISLNEMAPLHLQSEEEEEVLTNSGLRRVAVRLGSIHK